MTAFDQATLERWRALAIVDRNGATVGTVVEFYLDRETGHPTWALVNTGLFGTTHTFIPLVQATEISDGLQVPYEKRNIKDTPRVDPHDELTPDEEATLFAHYGVDYQPSRDPSPIDLGAAGSSVPSDESAAPEPADPSPADPDPAGSRVLAPETSALASDDPASSEPTGPADPGTTEPLEAARAGVDQPVSTDDNHLQDPPQAASDPSRPAPVQPGLHGSTSAVPSGPTPTTIDEPDGAAHPPPVDQAHRLLSPGPGRGDDADGATGDRGGEPELDPADAGDGRPPAEQDPSTAEPADQRPPALQDEPTGGDSPGRSSDSADPLAEEAPFAAKGPRAPGEASGTPGAPGTLDEPEPEDGPATNTDHWREAKLAAERDRIAREVAQSEGRSPLDRAKRRLGRLMPGGQDPADPDADERARRERLGLDDDPRSR
jgi:hypothetical protein